MTQARSTLKIVLRHGIWRIWLDGRFFADYRSKDQAIAGAEAAQRAMANLGKLADVVVTTEASPPGREMK